MRHLRDKHMTYDRKVPMTKRGIKTWRHGDRFPGLHIYKSREENDRLEEVWDNTRGADEVLVIGEPRLSKDERMVLRLPPGMTVNPKLDPKSFLNDNEQAMAKVRMSLRKEEGHDKGVKSLRDMGLSQEDAEEQRDWEGWDEVDIEDEKFLEYKMYRELNEEQKLELEKKDARLRQFFDFRDKSINLGKKSINDSKLNSKISLPGQLQVIKEAYINVRKDRYDSIQKDFYRERTKKGKQPSNLTP